MARIPLYSQGQLASSLTGVPRQNTAGQEVANTIAAGAANIQGALYSVAKDQFDEHKRLEREAIAEQKAREKELRDAQNTQQLVDKRESFDVEASKLYNDLKTKHYNDPSKIGPELQEGLKQLGTDTLGDVQDELLRAKIGNAITERAAGYVKDSQGFAFQRTPDLMKDAENKTKNNLVTAMRGASPDQLGEVIQKFSGDPENQKLFRYTNGEDAGNAMLEAVGKGYIARGDDLAAAGDVVGLKNLLEDPRFQASVPAEAARAATHDWETVSKQKIAEEVQTQNHAWQLEADSNKLNINDLDVNTDFNDQGSLNSTRKAYVEKYRELANSSNPHKVELMSGLVNKIQAIDSHSKALTKEQMSEVKGMQAEQKAAQKEAQREQEQAQERHQKAVYNSTDAIRARGKLAAMQAAISAKEKAFVSTEAGTHKKYGLQDQINDHQNFVNTLNNYKRQGFLNESGYQSSYNFIYGQGDKVNARLQKKSNTPNKAPQESANFDDHYSDYYGKFQTDHKVVGATKGMNVAQTKDALNTAYRDSMYRLRSGYVSRTGKDPSGSFLKEMDTVARDTAYRSVYGNR